MATKWKTLWTGLGGFVLLLASQGSAQAGCGYEPQKGVSTKTIRWEGGRSRFVLTDRGRDDDQEAIVGMWKVVLTAGGDTFDWGYSQWHSDGTEILNSGSRAPASENFCLGVWKKAGHNSYKLNHFALSYDPATGKLNATVNIRETVALDHTGNNFNGTFTVDITPTSADPIHIEGTIVGTRVTAE